ncbi:MAG: DUF4145 domain-containing protein [Gammaproteobacteria bacterium]
MLIDQCPHCHTSHVHTNVRFNEALEPKQQLLWWRVVRCQNPSCQRLILLTTNAKEDVQSIYPLGQYELETDVTVSQEIKDDFREAGLCLGSGCYKASMVMSRRVLQRCLKDQGCTQNRLVDAINYAIEQNILRKPFHPIAEEIRHFGNLGAHPDDDQLSNANRENATQIIEFARLLIHDFYEVPASAALLKQSRQKPS